MVSDAEKDYIFQFTYSGNENAASIEVGAQWDDQIDGDLSENEKLKIIGELMIQFGTRILSSEVGEVYDGNQVN